MRPPEQLSSNLGYGRLGGRRSSGEELSSVFDGMEKNGLLKPSRLLTGKASPCFQLSLERFLQVMYRARRLSS
jgi:pyridoxine kinase